METKSSPDMCKKKILVQLLYPLLTPVRILYKESDTTLSLLQLSPSDV